MRAGDSLNNFDCGDRDVRQRLSAAVQDGARDPRTRSVQDRTGHWWTIFQHDVGGIEGRHSVLLAESANAIRRMDVFPDDWEDMPDEALLVLIEAPVARLADVSARLESRWGDVADRPVCDGTDDEREWPAHY